MKRSLFKYFDDRRYARDFLDGKILFRSLAYFRDQEDPVRGDQYEGTSGFRPESGLEIHNLTQGWRNTRLQAFESSVRAGEIFVYCVSQTYNTTVAQEFNAVACVEITKIAIFCDRIQSALPPNATFKAGKIDYYPQSQAGSSRWALPDLIATSKLDRWAGQDEYRFVFSLTDALGFEKVDIKLTDRKHRPTPRAAEHFTHMLEARSLADICIMHELYVSLAAYAKSSLITSPPT